MRIAIGYLHPGWVTFEFHNSLLGLLRAAPDWPRFTTLGLRCGADLTRGRNRVVGAALELEVDYLWWLDTDVVFDQMTLTKLLAVNQPIAAALCYAQNEDGSVWPCAQVWDGEDQIRRATEADLARANRILPVAGVGMGCCLIERRVLTVLEAARDVGDRLWPYAEVSTEIADTVTEDDITFCLRARRIGGYVPVLVLDAKVGHVKSRVI